MCAHCTHSRAQETKQQCTHSHILAKRILQSRQYASILTWSTNRGISSGLISLWNLRMEKRRCVVNSQQLSWDSEWGSCYKRQCHRMPLEWRSHLHRWNEKANPLKESASSCKQIMQGLSCLPPWPVATILVILQPVFTQRESVFHTLLPLRRHGGSGGAFTLGLSLETARPVRKPSHACHRSRRRFPVCL